MAMLNGEKVAFTELDPDDIGDLLAEELMNRGVAVFTFAEGEEYPGWEGRMGHFFSVVVIQAIDEEEKPPVLNLGFNPHRRVLVIRC